MTGLFDAEPPAQPLAERLRPKTLDEVIGQRHLLGPGMPLRASFEAILSNGALPVRLHAVRRSQSAGCAIHHVVERIDIATAEGTRTAWVLATNVYWKTAQGWRMVLHHASPGTTKEPQPSETGDTAGGAPSTLH